MPYPCLPENEAGSEPQRAMPTRPCPPVRLPSPAPAAASAGARRRRPHRSSARSSRAMSVVSSARAAARTRGGAFPGRGWVTSRCAPGCPVRCLSRRVGRDLGGIMGTVGSGGGTSVTLCRVVKGDRQSTELP